MMRRTLGSALILVTLPVLAGAPPPPRRAESGDPCAERAEHHQLDFWIGEWDVYEEGKKVASSSIERLPGSCSVLESYSEPDGYAGKSINFFDAVLKKWRQTWVDKLGTVSEFTGELKSGAMQLEGITHTRDGKTILRRMTLSPTEPDKVRQYSEKSTDAGTTWGVAYDYLYVRRK